MRKVDLERRCKAISVKLGHRIDCFLPYNELKIIVEKYEKISEALSLISEMDLDALDEYCRENDVCQDDETWKVVYRQVFPDIYRISENIKFPLFEESEHRQFLPWKTLYYESLAMSSSPKLLSLVEDILNHHPSLFFLDEETRKELAKQYEVLNYILANNNFDWFEELLKLGSKVPNLMMNRSGGHRWWGIVSSAILGGNLEFVKNVHKYVTIDNYEQVARQDNVELVKYLLPEDVMKELPRHIIKEILHSLAGHRGPNKIEILEYLLSSNKFSSYFTYNLDNYVDISSKNGDIDFTRAILRFSEEISEQYQSREEVKKIALTNAVKFNHCGLVQVLLREFNISDTLFYDVAALSVANEELISLFLNESRFDINKAHKLIQAAAKKGRLLLRIIDDFDNQINHNTFAVALGAALSASSVEILEILLFDPAHVNSSVLAEAASYIFKEQQDEELTFDKIRLVMSSKYISASTTASMLFSALKYGNEDFIYVSFGETEIDGIDISFTEEEIIDVLHRLIKDKEYTASAAETNSIGDVLSLFTEKLYDVGFYNALHLIASEEKLNRLVNKKSKRYLRTKSTF